MPIWPKKEFFGKFHISDLLIYCALYHTAKLKKKNPKSRSWDLCLHNFGPQLGQIAQKMILGEISLKWFFSTYCALSCCEVWKESLKCESWDINLYKRYTLDILFCQNQVKKCSVGPKEDFGGNFTLKWFFTCFLCNIMLQSSKKNLELILSLLKFGIQLDQNHSFGPKHNCWGNFTYAFIYCLLTCCKVGKKIWEILKSRKVYRPTDTQIHTCTTRETNQQQ